MDDDSPTTNPNLLDAFKKIDRLWYDDADVVFCAGKSKFRVHRGILSAQSTIFKDMFSLPQGAGEVGTTTNEPFTVITLPDGEKDVYYFFLAIFDSSFYCPPPSSYPLSITMSILSLAHKYEVPFLILRAIAHLETHFPLDQKSLDSKYKPYWDEELRVAQLADSESDQISGTPGPSLTLGGNPTVGEYLDMLQIMDRVGITWIIPRVLYLLAKWYEIGGIMEHPSFGRLGTKYQVLVVKFDRNRMIAEHTKNSWAGILPSKDCQSQTTCGPCARAVSADDNGTYASEGASKSTLCRHCRDSAERYERKSQEKFWIQCLVLCDLKKISVATQLRKRVMKDFEKGVPTLREVMFD